MRVRIGKVIAKIIKVYGLYTLWVSFSDVLNCRSTARRQKSIFDPIVDRYKLL